MLVSPVFVVWHERISVHSMGNREDLLRGAKRCIVELGYARTTARDIADAAGTSLAAIGYHFGSKQNLVTTAMTEMLDRAARPDPGRQPGHPRPPTTR